MGCKVIHKTVMALSCALLFAAWAALAPAQEKVKKRRASWWKGCSAKRMNPPQSTWAPGRVRYWSARSVARGKTPLKPLLPSRPRSRPADLAGRLFEPPRGPEIIVFMSLSVPAAAWREWSFEAARIGAPLVLRGVARGGLRATVKRVGAHLAEGAGAAIDPRLFRLFEVKAVPAVAVVPGGVPPCESRGCSADPAPPHDLVRGNIGLDAALPIIAAEGGPGRETARRHLAETQGRTPMNRNFWLRTITFFLFAHLSITNTLAEDPKAAARAMGNAGRSAAAAVAQDPTSTSKVPGYAGTDRPERNLGAADLESAAARALADPGRSRWTRRARRDRGDDRAP